MAVGIKTKNLITVIGSADLLTGLFSSIFLNLEPNGWGSRFPNLMKTIYAGELSQKSADEIVEELKTIRREFEKIPPYRLFWDASDLHKKAPSGYKIPKAAANLAECLLTPGGQKLIDVLIGIFEDFQKSGGVASIVNLEHELARPGAMLVNATKGTLAD